MRACAVRRFTTAKTKTGLYSLVALRVNQVAQLAQVAGDLQTEAGHGRFQWQKDGQSTPLALLGTTPWKSRSPEPGTCRALLDRVMDSAESLKRSRYHALQSNGADRSPLLVDGRLLGRPLASMDRLENRTTRPRLLTNDSLNHCFRIALW